MAEIIETMNNSNAKIEYDDPYSGSPFFSGNSLSAKIEKSPTIILHQEEHLSIFKDTQESECASMENSMQELQETTSSVTSVEDRESNDQNKVEEEEVCYENVSDAMSSASNLQTNKEENPQTSCEPLEEIRMSGDSINNDATDPDGAIYDAPWDLGALQKGLEEKFKMNNQCSQEDPNLFNIKQPNMLAITTTFPLNSTPTRSSLPPSVAFQGKNSPELSDKFSKQGSNARQSTKGCSPSRKMEPIPIVDVTDTRQILQKRSILSFPSPQSTPTSSIKLQNFQSASLVSSDDRQHFQHPLQRRGVPVMGGGSVGRGHQHKPSASQVSDWRPLEDYDSPWDNRQKDLMSTFSQDSSSLRGSMKNITQHQFSSLVERIESRLPLEHEWWYHGPITRQDAEKRLKSEREGSYLIRNSESNRLDYSLSIKSSTGCIHLKIVPNSEGRFILGQFSQPFSSVAQMIQHYTVNKLPIKGAEHMSLTFPVGH